MKKAITIMMILSFTFHLIFPHVIFANELLEPDFLPSPPVNIQGAIAEQRELTIEEFDYFTGLFKRYLFFRDGQIVVNNYLFHLEDILEVSLFEEMVSGIHYLNKLSEQGFLNITDNGTI